MFPLCCLYYSIVNNIYQRYCCRTSRLADCVVTSSFRRIAINNGIAIIKLAEVLLLHASPRGRGQTNHHTITQQSNRDDGERVPPPPHGRRMTYYCCRRSILTPMLVEKEVKHMMSGSRDSILTKQQSQSTYAWINNSQ